MKMHNHKWTKSNSLVPLRMAMAVLEYDYRRPVAIKDITGLSFNPHPESDSEFGSGKIRVVELQIDVDWGSGLSSGGHMKTVIRWNHEDQRWDPVSVEYGNRFFRFM